MNDLIGQIKLRLKPLEALMLACKGLIESEHYEASGHVFRQACEEFERVQDVLDSIGDGLSQGKVKDVVKTENKDPADKAQGQAVSTAPSQSTQTNVTQQASGQQVLKTAPNTPQTAQKATPSAPQTTLNPAQPASAQPAPSQDGSKAQTNGGGLI